MAKVKVHNEWFRPIKLGNRKSCPTCKYRTTKFYSWGEYHAIRWYTVKHFCEHCFNEQVKKPLLKHADPCGCDIQLQWRGDFYTPRKPTWLTLG
jgi:hypothetical protein